MTQLPPKSPTTTTAAAATMHPNWPNFAHGNPPAQPSWVDEFLDFSSVRRGSHRRSSSDSIAFFEAQDSPDFDRLDDDQLMSMFSNDPPSDHNSNNEENPADEKAAGNESEEAQSAFKAQPPVQDPTAVVIDPKRVKRILANRRSAQRSRVRKLQYISELERSVTTLQTEVSALSPRVAFLDHQRSILTVGNSHLKLRIAALAQDRIFKDAHQEALRKEIERLRQVYHQQSLKKMDAPNSDPAAQTDEQLLC